RRLIANGAGLRPAARRWRFPGPSEEVLTALAARVAEQEGLEEVAAHSLALRLLLDDPSLRQADLRAPTLEAAHAARESLAAAGIEPRSAVIEARYTWIADVCRRV